MIRRALGAAIAIILLASGVGWMLTSPEPLPTSAVEGPPGDPERGALVFAAAGCASCHVAPDTDIGEAPVLAGGMAFGLAIGWQTRVGRALTIACGVAAAGLLLIWGRALWVEAPVLARPVTTEFSARVEAAEPLPAREQLRLVVRPFARPDLPPRLRLTLRGDQRRPIVPGTMIGVRARLMPPPTASLPGG